MNYINVYSYVLKNKKKYNIIFTNFKYKIFLVLTLNYNLRLKLKMLLYRKLIRRYIMQNGFKLFLFEN